MILPNTSRPDESDPPDDPRPAGPAGTRSLAFMSADAVLPLAHAIPPAWCFRAGLHGMVVPVSVDTDDDGEPDTCAFTGWRAEEGEREAKGSVTTIRPLPGHRTCWEHGRHEALALARAKEWLSCPRLVRDAA